MFNISKIHVLHYFPLKLLLKFNEHKLFKKIMILVSIFLLFKIGISKNLLIFWYTKYISFRLFPINMSFDKYSFVELIDMTENNYIFAD